MARGMNILGIPLRYDPNMKTIAESRGLWPFKAVYLGPQLPCFPPREQQAFLLHEAGHCMLFHLEKRIANLWRLVWPPAFFRYLRMQELQADRFVAHCGYGEDLARGFERIIPTQSVFHPPISERVARLRQA